MSRTTKVPESPTEYNSTAFKHIFPLLRFQNNPYCSHILCEDIYSCAIGSNGELEIKTYVDKTNKIPKAFEWAWPKNLSRRVRFIEEIQLDYFSENGTQTITHLSRNISVRHVMTTHERSWFRFKNDEVTVEKEFLCDSFLKTGFGSSAVQSALRNFGFWRYKTNEKLANQGLKHQCDLWIQKKL